YVVDNLGDAVYENPNEGTDIIRVNVSGYTLSANVEIGAVNTTTGLTLYGSNQGDILFGNNGDDVLIGGGGNDQFSAGLGNDTVDGGVGADSMGGGTGNDTYVVDNLGDAVYENPNEGTDIVRVSVSGYTLSANAEIGAVNTTTGLTLYGNNQGVILFGNNGDDVLIGGGGNDQFSAGLGNDVIDGGVGADSMGGWLGNDTYFVDNLGDAVYENVNEGTDRVQSSVTYTLGANVENLTLTGSGNINGTGNSGNNNLTGNSGANILDGRGGADILTGGAGNDVFLFHPGEANGDTVVDFAGQGAASGDSLLFIGYGAGATLTQIDATHWEVNYNGGADHEVITFSNAAAFHASDYAFA
ncbi:MAG: calcium-binding protein, partial [Rhodoplanes sp.]